ncbi:MAG TPA: serine hydrolase domain-containing protein [Planctomycetota bacterium]|nr:serine hydrolase domain-containing protein [Planctomycetota bacterium]
MPRKLLGLLALSFLSGCVAPPLEPTRVGRITQIVEKHLARSKAPGLVIGVIEGKKQSVLGFGRVSLKSEEKPGAETVYEIGSITKVFTTFLLAALAQEGLVGLNDPIRVHLPKDVTAPRSDNKEITFTHLATHTSGLPPVPANLPAFTEDPYANYGADRLYDYLRATNRLKYPVESKYEYSNLGMGLLGHLLERASTMTYEELVVQRIANPLGMRDTRITLTESMQARLAWPYDVHGKPAHGWNFRALAGCGALRSTVRDLLRFAAANLGQGDPRLTAVLASCHAVRLKEDVFPDRLRVGLGWHHSPLRAGGKWVIWHNGGTGGYTSFLGFAKETGTAVVVLTNSGPSMERDKPSAADQIGMEVLEYLNP